jgi:hypothetical protein
MSLASLAACTADPAMQERIVAQAQQLAYGPEENTDFAARIRVTPDLALVMFSWPTSINCEASYESGALLVTGGAANVLDGEILAAVTAHWPQDPIP